MVAVADRQVLARLEEEVAAAQAEHDPAGQPRRPDDRAAEDLRQVVQERVAAVLGGLDHPHVLVGAERQAVGALHPALRGSPRPRRRPSAGSRRPIVPSGSGCERRGLGDAGDPGLLPAVEDGDVLADRDLLGGAVERLEVDVDGAAVAVAQLRAGDVKSARSSTSGSTRRRSALTPPPRRRLDRLDPAQVGGRVLPAVRADEVDQAARRERAVRGARAPPRRAASSSSR